MRWKTTVALAVALLLVGGFYYLYEVLRRVNLMLCRDTKESEFVTLFYGVYDARPEGFPSGRPGPACRRALPVAPARDVPAPFACNWTPAGIGRHKKVPPPTVD